LCIKVLVEKTPNVSQSKHSSLIGETGTWLKREYYKGTSLGLK
jgi:hypothetical protein